MDRYYLVALGSNEGDRVHYIDAAKKMLTAKVGPIEKTAPIFETVPIGAADKLFLNTAVVVRSVLDPSSCLTQLLYIERQLGRERHVHWGNRTMDLDMLLYRDAQGVSQVISTSNLAIPHPRMLERDFVLVPARAVAGDWVHPGSGLTLDEECRRRGFQLQETFCKH